MNPEAELVAKKPAHVWVVPATVNRIVDGDTPCMTLDALAGRLLYHGDCRIAHIDCPKGATPEGQAATAFVTSLMPPGTVVTYSVLKLEKYGRPLGTVTLPDGRDLGRVLLNAGHAVPYEGGTR